MHMHMHRWGYALAVGVVGALLATLSALLIESPTGSESVRAHAHAYAPLVLNDLPPHLPTYPPACAHS